MNDYLVTNNLLEDIVKPLLGKKKPVVSNNYLHYQQLYLKKFKISSVELNPDRENISIKVNDIEKTKIYQKMEQLQ